MKKSQEASTNHLKWLELRISGIKRMLEDIWGQRCGANDIYISTLKS
jgi:hypothetical protein